jgi:hypothetical protein
MFELVLGGPSAFGGVGVQVYLADGFRELWEGV